MPDSTQQFTPARRRSSGFRRRGPLLISLWFAFVGFNWFALILLALHYLRPHPLVASDYAIGVVGFGLGILYLWVACAVYQRRKYILTVAFTLAGFGLFGVPFGTIISIMLLAGLASRKHEFTK